MIFLPELARKIARGEKTQTRRPIKPIPGEQSPMIVSRKTGQTKPRPASRRDPVTAMVNGQPVLACKYLIGHTYAVQPGRGKDGICHILVENVQAEPAGAITYTAARAEGFRTTDEFKATWVRLYDARWIASQEETTDEDGVITTDRHLMTSDLVPRFDEHHADTLVWAITFRVDTEHRPRLMRARPNEAGDYTETALDAMRGEPEAIPAGLLDYYTKDAHERFAGQPGRREENLRKYSSSLANRLRQAAVAAQRAGDHPDTVSTLALIEEHIKTLERQRGAA
jgi:hypothetical protein